MCLYVQLWRLEGKYIHAMWNYFVWSSISVLSIIFYSSQIHNIVWTKIMKNLPSTYLMINISQKKIPINITCLLWNTPYRIKSRNFRHFSLRKAVLWRFFLPVTYMRHIRFNFHDVCLQVFVNKATYVLHNPYCYLHMSWRFVLFFSIVIGW